MRIIIFLLAMLGSISTTHAQAIYFDPTVAAATYGHSSLMNDQLNKTNNNLTLIQRGQLAVTGQLIVVNDLQQAIYKGLSEVSSAVRSLIAIQDIAEVSADIVTDVNKAVTLAQSNPLLLLFAEGGAREFKRRGTALAVDVSAFVLQGGSGNLMDSGERAKLLNRIRTELMILRGVAYGMQRAMYWAKQRGILNSLNPYAGFVNMDLRIAGEIVSNSKLIKK